MGKYDIPAVIDYVLANTTSERLSYICHSLGCGTFFIAAIERPAVNERVDVALALGPSTATRSNGNFFWLPEPILRPALKALGVTSIPASNTTLQRSLTVLCGRRFVVSVCRDFFMSVTGFNRC